MKIKIVAMFVVIILPTIVQALEYNCTITRKLSLEREYTTQEISKGQFSVLIEENRGFFYLSRCSFIRCAGKVTCDRYEVDKVSLDKNVNIKKYYVFRSHFDVQLFSNLTFIENNGRAALHLASVESYHHNATEQVPALEFYYAKLRKNS